MPQGFIDFAKKSLPKEINPLGGVRKGAKGGFSLATEKRGLTESAVEEQAFADSTKKRKRAGLVTAGETGDAKSTKLGLTGRI